MSEELRAVWEVECQLGEGPVWLAKEQALCFVDIKAGHLHRYYPSSDSHHTLDVGGMPSFVCPCEGALVVGSGHNLHLIDSSGSPVQIATLPMPEHNRTNDGTVDCHGRIWFGTMDNEEALPTGQLWCLDRGRLYPMGKNAVVTNGPALSPDASVLYHVDSSRRTIWRLSLGMDDAGRPQVIDQEIFLQLGEDDGYPDGIVLDAEGCLWVGLWDGWGVRRYSPEGSLMRHVPFPCARVTKLAFGGPDLMTAFVTTARVGLNAADIAEQPLAGALFAFDSPVPGLPGTLAQLHATAQPGLQTCVQ